MTELDERIRHGLWTATQPVDDPDPGVLAPLLAERRRHRAADSRAGRTRWWAVAAAVVVVAAVAGGLVLFTGGPDLVTVATNPSPNSSRPDLVVTTGSGASGIWDGSTWKLRLPLSPASEVVVNPDGQTAIVARPGPGEGCDARPLEEVSLDDPTVVPRVIVGGATNPMISPDGLWVAYQYRCKGVGVGVTNLDTLQNWRVSISETDERPLAWVDEHTLLFGSDADVQEVKWSGRTWGESTSRHDLPGPAVANPWSTNGPGLLFGVGSRLEWRLGTTDRLVHDFGRDGATSIEAITPLGPTDQSEVVVTTRGANGSLEAWLLTISGEATEIEALALPPDTRTAAPGPH